MRSAETTIAHVSSPRRRGKFAVVGVVLGIALAGCSDKRDEPAPAVTTDTEWGIRARCEAALVERAWARLRACGEELNAYSPITARTILSVAARETKAEDALVRLRTAPDPASASALLAQIPEDSVYRPEAERMANNQPAAPRATTTPPPAANALKRAGDDDPRK